MVLLHNVRILLRCLLCACSTVPLQCFGCELQAARATRLQRSQCLAFGIQILDTNAKELELERLLVSGRRRDWLMIKLGGTAPH